MRLDAITETFVIKGLRFHDIYCVYCTHSDIAMPVNVTYKQGQLGSITLANRLIMITSV